MQNSNSNFNENENNENVQSIIKPIKYDALQNYFNHNNPSKKQIVPVLKETVLLNNFKILIVDDNKINMLLTKTLVRNKIPNSIIYEAKNGQEAVEITQDNNPNIIFMDIQMPIMNGYEATRAIRKLKSGQEIPIIAITAGTEKEEKCKCLEAGMNDYISKPILKGIIEETILKWTK